MRKHEDAKISEQEQNVLNWNLQAMQESFNSSTLKKRELYLLKRYVEDKRYTALSERIKAEHPVLHEALCSDLLPSYKTLENQLKFGQYTSCKLVDKLAQFCTKVFDFDHQVTSNELLSRKIYPFPKLSSISGLWGRYVGIYRCFYMKSADTLTGGILEFQEKDGLLHVRTVIDIEKDNHLEDIEKLMREHSGEEFEAAFDRFHHSIKREEAHMSFYEGTADCFIPEYFFLKLWRKNSRHSIQIYLRRWATTKHPRYDGGFGLTTHCRADDINCYVQIITRQKFSLIGDRDLLCRQLLSVQGANNMIMEKKMDESLSKMMRDWAAKHH